MEGLWGLHQALDVRRRKGPPKPGAPPRRLIRLGSWYQPMVALSGAPEPNDFP